MSEISIGSLQKDLWTSIKVRIQSAARANHTQINFEHLSAVHIIKLRNRDLIVTEHHYVDGGGTKYWVVSWKED